MANPADDAKLNAENLLQEINDSYHSENKIDSQVVEGIKNKIEQSLNELEASGFSKQNASDYNRYKSNYLVGMNVLGMKLKSQSLAESITASDKLLERMEQAYYAADNINPDQLEKFRSEMNDNFTKIREAGHSEKDFSQYNKSQFMSNMLGLRFKAESAKSEEKANVRDEIVSSEKRFRQKMENFVDGMERFKNSAECKRLIESNPEKYNAKFFAQLDEYMKPYQQVVAAARKNPLPDNFSSKDSIAPLLPLLLNPENIKANQDAWLQNDSLNRFFRDPQYKNFFNAALKTDTFDNYQIMPLQRAPQLIMQFEKLNSYMKETDPKGYTPESGLVELSISEMKDNTKNVNDQIKQRDQQAIELMKANKALKTAEAEKIRHEQGTKLTSEFNQVRSNIISQLNKAFETHDSSKSKTGKELSNVAMQAMQEIASITIDQPTDENIRKGFEEMGKVLNKNKLMISGPEKGLVNSIRTNSLWSVLDKANRDMHKSELFKRFDTNKQISGAIKDNLKQNYEERKKSIFTTIKDQVKSTFKPTK